MKSCSHEPGRVWRKGEFKPSTRKKPNGPKNLESGISFEVSNADFSVLKTKFIDASRWFSENESLVNSLASLAAVDDIAMDFGAKIQPPGWCTFSFPPELQTLIGGLGAHLVLSIYPTNADAPEV